MCWPGGLWVFPEWALRLGSEQDPMPPRDSTISYLSGSLPRAILFPGGHLTMFGDNLVVTTGGGVILVSVVDTRNAAIHPTTPPPTGRMTQPQTTRMLKLGNCARSSRACHYPTQLLPQRGRYSSGLSLPLGRPLPPPGLPLPCLLLYSWKLLEPSLVLLGTVI